MTDDATNRPGPHRARIDEAIDRAVRDIMHHEPPPGLRRRVLARLDTPDPRRRFLPQFAFAAVALVAVVAAVMVLRNRGDGENTAAPRTEIAATQPAAPSTPPAAPVTVATPAPEKTAAPPVAVRQAPPRVERRQTPPADRQQLERIFGPRQGLVSATSVKGADAAPPASVPPPADLPDAPGLAITPIKIDPLFVPPIIIR